MRQLCRDNNVSCVCIVAVLCALLLAPNAAAQTGTPPDFLHPQQRGPFQVNGLFYLEFGHFTDPIQIGYPVPTLDQIIPEIKATGANVVKLTITVGQVKNYNDNIYDPGVPFPLEGKSADIVAFGRKLKAQGLPCLMVPFSTVENVVVGSSDTSHVDPADRRAFMAQQHIPRLVSLAQLAEDMGCEYFSLFGDDMEHLAGDPTLTDLWIQAITQIRTVFSGRLTSMAAWGDRAPWTADFPPEMVGMLDIFGIGFAPAFTDHNDPTVAELVASYQKNSAGHNTLQTVTDLHTLYAKPMLFTDIPFGSFTGANVLGDDVLFGQFPRSQFTVDYQEQVNLYQAFFQATPSLDPNWMLGVAFDSFDRFPYEWKDVNTFPYLGSLGESIRGKPALQTLTLAFQTSQPIRTPASGWWTSPGNPGIYYALEAENGVVRVGILAYSAQGDPQWSMVRCVETAPGSNQYAGTSVQYAGGRALNGNPAPPTGVIDGASVSLTFTSTTTATLQIGAQSIPIQRYQFSGQWASPMLNAPRTGWWDQAVQSGRGYFFEVQGNTLFAGGLVYSSSGQPSWFTSIASVDATGTFVGNVTICSAGSGSEAPVCRQTADSMRIVFSSPWRATLTLSQEASVEIRRYRPTEIGWPGRAPSFEDPNPQFMGQALAVEAGTDVPALRPGAMATITGTDLTRGISGVVEASVTDAPFSIRGTSVLVSGIPARLASVANLGDREQITFRVPSDIEAKPIPAVPYQNQFIVTTAPTVSIVVANNGAVSPPLRAAVYNRADTQNELIGNDSFENATGDEWGCYVLAPAVASCERTTVTTHDGNYSEHVSVTTAGATHYVQFYQSNLALTAGTIYEFHFWAKASNTRHMRVGILKGGGDFHSYGLSTVYTLGTDWQLCRAVFEATETAADARLIFYLGEQTGDLWLDDVELTAVGTAQPSRTASVPQSGWWWDPKQSGIGFFIEQGGKSGTGMFVGGFLYDTNGNATWLVSTGPMSGSTYTSNWLRVTGGQTLLGTYKAPNPSTTAGSLSMTFTDATHAVMTRPDGTQINLQRFSFTGTPPAAPIAGAPQSGWWWAGSNLGGTGYGIEIQGSSVFIVAYVYDDTGNPVWYLATGALASPTSYTGTWDLYAGGPQLTSPEGTYAAHKVSTASPMTLTFSDATHGTLTMGNVVIPIARFQEF